MVDLPREPRPSPNMDDSLGRTSEGTTWTLVEVPLYAMSSELPNMQLEKVASSSRYSRQARWGSLSTYPWLRLWIDGLLSKAPWRILGLPGWMTIGRCW